MNVGVWIGLAPQTEDRTPPSASAALDRDSVGSRRDTPEGRAADDDWLTVVLAAATLVCQGAASADSPHGRASRSSALHGPVSDRADGDSSLRRGPQLGNLSLSN